MTDYIQTADMDTIIAEANLSNALEFDIDVNGQIINIATTYDPNNRVLQPFLFKIDPSGARVLLELYADGFKRADQVEEWVAEQGYDFPSEYFDGLKQIESL